MNIKKILFVLSFVFICMAAKAQVMHFDSITCVNSATQETAIVTVDFRITSRGSQDQLEIEFGKYPGYDKPVILNFCKLPYAGDSRLMRLESGVWCITNTLKKATTYLLIGDIVNNGNAYAPIQIEYREKNKKVDKYPYNLIMSREAIVRIHEYLNDCLVDGVLEEKRM